MGRYQGFLAFSSYFLLIGVAMKVCCWRQPRAMRKFFQEVKKEISEQCSEMFKHNDRK